jgi:hypothetical protein
MANNDIQNIGSTTPWLTTMYKTSDRQHHDEQRSTKHYAENQISRNTNPTKNRGRTHVTSFAGVAGMLLHVNVNVKPSLLS